MHLSILKLLVIASAFAIALPIPNPAAEELFPRGPAPSQKKTATTSAGSPPPPQQQPVQPVQPQPQPQPQTGSLEERLAAYKSRLQDPQLRSTLGQSQRRKAGITALMERKERNKKYKRPPRSSLSTSEPTPGESSQQPVSQPRIAQLPQPSSRPPKRGRASQETEGMDQSPSKRPSSYALQPAQWGPSSSSSVQHSPASRTVPLHPQTPASPRVPRLRPAQWGSSSDQPSQTVPMSVPPQQSGLSPELPAPQQPPPGSSQSTSSSRSKGRSIHDLLN